MSNEWFALSIGDAKVLLFFELAKKVVYLQFE
jgi:hypothetical protein